MNPLEQSQTELVDFLSHGRAYGLADEPVERITTHISQLFLVGDRAYKLKRAVKLPYVDFLMPESRRIACEREVALNRRTAPDIYVGIRPVTRDASGELQIGGKGSVIDWLVEMRRFDQDALLDRIAEAGPLDPMLLRELADAIARFHATAERVPTAGGAAAMKAIIDGNGESFAACPDGAFDAESIRSLQLLSTRSLDEVGTRLDRRKDMGKVRRCHGDLHLRNICVIHGRPTLFDCIEFDDRLTEIDVLYDLAFALMDFLHRGLGRDANLVFNRYLDRTDESDGIAALPLFLSQRAAIRAHVSACEGPTGLTAARDYLALALRLIQPPPPRLVAIGGLSGTGKSTLAYGVAPELGAAPGARILRSDVLRKRLFGIAPEEKLDDGAYAPEVTARVYATLLSEAAAVLRSGHSVILDAVHARAEERDAAREAARSAGVSFHGFWLEAPRQLLEKRLAERRNDASDADIGILHRQLHYAFGAIDWIRVDASTDANRMLTATRVHLR